MKKVTYIISDVHKSLAFEWIATYLNKEKYLLSFILLNNEATNLEDFLTARNFEVYRVQCRGKKDWLTAIRQTYRILRKLSPDAVHCHLIQANIIGLTAAKMAGVKKRIYTRHHSSLHHVYFKKGVLLDRFANKVATHIIAISGIVKHILLTWEKVRDEKVYLIHHGFMLADFSDVDERRVEDFKKRNLLAGNYPIVGVVARFTHWKGIQYILPAFKKFLEDYPQAILLLMNAHGDYEKIILKKLEAIPSSSFRLVKFETDIAAAYHAMDLFVHVPVDDHSEAFGQTYVEALAAGVPSVFTLSGIAADFIVDGENAMVVPFQNSDAIYTALNKLVQDEALRKRLITNGRESVNKLFTLDKMMNALEDIYEN